MKSLGMLALILTLAAFSPVAAINCAADDSAVPAKVQNQKFVDVDGDGICDNQNLGLHRGNGKAFVDANSDGICDNCGGTGKCLSRGQAKGLTNNDCDGIKDKRENAKGLKRGQTDTRHNANFIDRNADGISDNPGKGFSKDRSGLKQENSPITQ